MTFKIFDLKMFSVSEFRMFEPDLFHPLWLMEHTNF